MRKSRPALIAGAIAGSFLGLSLEFQVSFDPIYRAGAADGFPAVPFCEDCPESSRSFEPEARFRDVDFPVRPAGEDFAVLLTKGRKIASE